MRRWSVGSSISLPTTARGLPWAAIEEVNKGEGTMEQGGRRWGGGKKERSKRKKKTSSLIGQWQAQHPSLPLPR